MVYGQFRMHDHEPQGVLACAASASDMPFICSHQARPDADFKRVPNIANFKSLVSEGIGCFDLDVQTSRDKQLFVGHPTMVSESLDGAKAEDVEASRLEEAKVPKLKVCKRGLDAFVLHLELPTCENRKMFGPQMRTHICSTDIHKCTTHFPGKHNKVSYTSCINTTYADACLEKMCINLRLKYTKYIRGSKQQSHD
jgi:hypothetical protein